MQGCNQDHDCAFFGATTIFDCNVVSVELVAYHNLMLAKYLAKILSVFNALTYLNSTTGSRFKISVFVLCGSITPSTVRRNAAMETVPLFDSEYLANQTIK